MQVGSSIVTHLDTSTHRLTKLTEIPNQNARLAHQVIFMPATETAKKGTVYVFGGKLNSMEFQEKNYKYDIATGQWQQVPDMPSMLFSFNLIPLINYRYILVVAHEPLLFDTETDSWVPMK